MKINTNIKKKANTQPEISPYFVHLCGLKHMPDVFIFVFF